MKKTRVLLFVAIILAVLLTALSGCVGGGAQKGKIPVERILLDQTDVYIASHGENSVFQIYPRIYPENASQKEVIFSFADFNDTEFLTVTDTGAVSARKIKEDKPVEILVRSAEDPKITASIFFHIENRTVERAYFNPRTREVYTDQKPFTVKPSYVPSHAAEGINFTFSSDQESVATVDSNGEVTIKGRGTAHIIATNSGGIQAFLELKVLHARPSYRLEEAPSSTNAYNQIPGQPISIGYTLIPGQSNDPNCRIRWYAEEAEQESYRDKLTFTYTPGVDISPQVYNVRVEVTDSDNQKQTIISKDINIYNQFTGLLGVDMDVETEYFVSDQILMTPRCNTDEQRPDSFRWYVRTFGLDDPIPADIKLDNNFTYLASTQFETKEGAYVYMPSRSGKQVIALVPMFGNNEMRDKVVFSSPFVVNLLQKGNPYYRVDFTAVAAVSAAPKLKINWGYMPQETVYVVEIEQNGQKTFISSAMPEYADLFTETSLTIPTSVLTPSQGAKIRLRTDRYGYGETYYYNANDATIVGASQDAPIDRVPFNFVINNMAEMGDIFNYVRFFRPGQPNGAAVVPGITYKTQQGTTGAEHVFEMDISFAFDFESVKDAYQAETFSQVTNSHLMQSHIIGTVSNADQYEYLMQDFNEVVNKVFSAFLAYSEAGRIAIGVGINYKGTIAGTVNTKKGTFGLPTSAQQAYTPTIAIILQDEPTELHVSTGTPTPKDTAGYLRLKPTTPRGEAYDSYFVNNRGEMLVENGQQLYLAASWGYLPKPKAGSRAEEILTKAKSVLNRILGEDIQTEQEKSRAIYDYLVLEIDYDNQLAQNANADFYSEGFWLDGVFLRDTAVCDGLSKAFNLMAWMEGIVSLKVSGTAGRVGHAWNKVLADGEWFLIDTTWGGTTGRDGMYIPTTAYALKKEGEPGFIEGSSRVTYGEYPMAK